MMRRGSIIIINRGRVDDLSFFDYLCIFYFLLIEFQCTFSISYKILPDYASYYCISIKGRTDGEFFGGIRDS